MGLLRRGRIRLAKPFIYRLSRGLRRPSFLGAKFAPKSGARGCLKFHYLYTTNQRTRELLALPYPNGSRDERLSEEKTPPHEEFTSPLPPHLPPPEPLPSEGGPLDA